MKTTTYSIPKFGLTIHNDNPPFLKPRRTVWYICRDGKMVFKKHGGFWFFKSAGEASVAMQRLATKMQQAEEVATC